MSSSRLAIISVPASAQVVETCLLARNFEEAGFKTEIEAGPEAKVTLGSPWGLSFTYEEASKFLRTVHGERRPVGFKRIRPDAILPAAGSVSAAGLDLHACIDAPFSLRPGESRLVPTGWAFACPPRTYGRIAPRSGMSVKGFLVNAGVVDSDFRGEVQVLLAYLGGNESSPVVNPGDRVAQLIFERFTETQVIETLELNNSDRGESGWGSTGT
jgi:dUTP pyrophosphatase